MATNREAARRQRLRGAQTREPQNVEFAFTLPAAPAPAPAKRTTRSGVTPSPARVTRTPVTRDRGRGGATLETQSSSGRKRAAPTTPGDDVTEKRQRVDNLGGNAQNGNELPVDITAVGLDGVIAETLPMTQDQVQVQSYNTVTPERDLNDEDELSSINAMAQTSSQPSRRGIDISEEVTESPRNAPGSGRRQALSAEPAEQAARLRDVLSTPTRLPTGVVTANASPTSARGSKTRRTLGHMHTRPSPELERPGAATTTPKFENQMNEEDEIDELSPDQPRNIRAGERFSDEEGDEEPEEDEQEASEIPDAEAAKQLQSRRRQRSEGLEEEDVGEESEESEVEADTAAADRQQTSGKHLPISFDGRRLPSKGSPAQQRAPKARMTTSTTSKPKAKLKSTKKDKAAAKNKTSSSRSTELIPVTAYRMTRPAAALSDSEDDILNSAIPFTSRSGVNAVDVLAQVGDEILSGALEALEQGTLRAEEEGSMAERREYRTKLRAVEALGEEFRWKLMELTISLDAEHSMRKRVKAAVREKVELRTELLRIRAEREKIALKMDGVRTRHEEEGKESETLTSLSTTLHDIGLAASLGRDSVATSNSPSALKSSLSDPPLPVLLEQVAGLASSKSKEGGLLKRLRDFNGFLERVAGAIEGR